MFDLTYGPSGMLEPPIDPPCKQEFQDLREGILWPNYRGILAEQGKSVYLGEAFAYALDKCGIELRDDFDEYHNKEHKEFKTIFVEWFFSGAWKLIGISADGEH